MSTPFQQVSHVPANDGNGVPDVAGRCFSIRVMKFVAGATIAFGDVNNKLLVIANCNWPFPSGGWERIYLTGTITIEYATVPALILEPVTPAADQAGNTPVVGPAADAAQASGAPVLVAGKDGAGAVKTIGVGALSGAAPAGICQVGGNAGDGKNVPIPITREGQPVFSTVDGTYHSTVGGKDAGGAGRALLIDTGARQKIVEREADWGITNTSVAAGTATATKAALGGVRHVCKTLAASLAAGAAAQGPVNVVLRDGATGVGAIIHSGELAAPANTGDSYTPAPLNLVGTAGNAMTVEFAAAGAANTIQTVNVAGYDRAAND